MDRDEFIRVFGVTPEEFAEQFTIAGKKQEVPTYKSDLEKLYEQRGQKMGPVTSTVNRIIAPSERVQKNVAAGILATPSSVGGVVDLVRKGVSAVAAGIMNEDEDDDPLTTRIADEFVNRILPPESIQRLEAAQIEAVEKFKQQNPGVTEEDIRKFVKWYSDSDDFYQKTVEELPVGMRIATQGQNWANRTVGLDARADEMSPEDEALQILGGAFVGIPKSVVSSVSKPIAKAVGERIANNIALKAAGRVAEVVTPVTFPMTPSNVALNAAAGVGINEAIRGVQGEDTLIDYSAVYNPEKVPAPESLVAATGITAAAIFGLPGTLRTVRDQAVRRTKEAIDLLAQGGKIGQTAGETLEEQSDRMTPNLSSVTGLADQNAPVVKAAQKFGADAETKQLLDAAMSAASPANVTEFSNNAMNYGILDGLGRNTVPYVQVRAAYDRLDPATKDMYDKYVYAVQRKQDGTIYEQSLLKQLRTAQANVTANPRSKRAQDELVAIQQKYNQYQADDPSSRSSLVDWTREDVERFIRQGESNPAVKQLADATRKISNDLVEYLRKNGLISNEEAARRLRTRDLYVPLQERARAGETGLKRRALLFKDKVMNKLDDTSDQASFINMPRRDVSGEGAKVNRPKSAIVALKEAIDEAVYSVAINNTRRDVIDKLDALPNARGNLLRPYNFGSQGRTNISISPEQYAVVYPRGVKNEDNYIKIFRDGKIELWEMSDKSLTKALQFAPLASVPIMNATRQIWQTMTTGLGAPWFAAKTFAWDVPLAQTTKQAGRSLGLIDTLARRLATGTALEGPVNSLMDNVFDPTAFVSAGLAIPYQLGLRAARAVGDKIATDLATNSSVFNSIARTGPQGEQFVRSVGTFMANAFDQSALGVMSRNMSTSLSHLNDISKHTDDYANAALGHTGPARAMFNMYKAMLESVHMSTRTAFFASNYGRLKAQYGDNIPASEIKKLVQETRNLTGDMSRRSNSKFIQRLTTVVPYSNAMIQGTRHLLSAATPDFVARGVNRAGGNMLTDRNTRFWTQFTSGMLLPVLGSAAVLSNWEGAEDYWYNRTPKWKQMSTIPIPSVEALEHLAENGELPPFSEDLINEIPIAPEFALVLEPIKAGLRAMGMFGSGATKFPTPFSTQVKEVMDQITGFSTPPILGALFATQNNRLDLHGLVTGGNGVRPIRDIPSGGANADMMTTNSDIPAAVYNTIAALAGSAAQIAMQTYNVFDIAKKETDDFWEALDAATDTAGFEIKRRLPAVSVPGLFDARQRLYSSTPESEYVYKTERELEPIIGSGRQMSVERDTSGRIAEQEALGLTPAAKIKDPNLKQLSALVYDELKRKGAYKTAKDTASTIRAHMQALEASRYKMDDDKYNKKRNEMIKAIQAQTRIMSQELVTLEKKLQKALGRRFIQQYGKPFSFAVLGELVRKDVSQ